MVPGTECLEGEDPRTSMSIVHQNHSMQPYSINNSNTNTHIVTNIDPPTHVCISIVHKISQATFTDSNGCCSVHTPQRDDPLVSNSDFFFFNVCISVVDFRLNKGYQPVTDYLNIFTSTIGVVIAR